MEEKKQEKKRNKLYERMKKIRMVESKTFGDQFKYIRGQGLVRRNEEE